MSESIDNRVVEMRFNNKQFESGVQTTLSTLDRLKQALNFKNRKTGLDDLQTAANKIDLSHIDKAADMITKKFSMMGTVGDEVLRRLTDSVINFSHSLVRNVTLEPLMSGFSEYEEKMGSVQTIMAGTGASVEEVSNYLDELNHYSDKTIYSFMDMTSNIGKFTNAGVKLDTAVKAIQGIANEAAVSGANTQEASRAMYNFAQALSAGYVKLIDWKSIENANMATVEFKDTLIQTAQALGTVVKKGDGYVTTTTNMQGKVSDVFNATKNFNDSLNNQWMTTDVLTTALEIYSTDVRDMTDAQKEAYESGMKAKGFTDDQIKAFEELGIKAFNSATEIKTFSMLIDTLKEALGSGWTETWELIFGNFEQAKTLWTSIGNVLGDFINKTADARNNLIRAWSESDIGGRADLIKALRDAFYGLLLILKPIQVAFQDVFPPATVDSLRNLTLAFYDLTEQLWPTRESTLAIHDIFTRFFSLLKYGINVVTSITRGLTFLIKPLIRLVDSSVVFVAKVLAKLTGSNGLEDLNRKIKNLGNTIKYFYYGVMLTIADAIDKFSDFLRNADLDHFDGALSNIISHIKAIASYIPNTLLGVKSIFSSLTNISPINKVLTVIKSIATTLLYLAVGVAVKVVQGVKNIISAIKSFRFTSITDLLKGLGNYLAQLFEKLKNGNSILKLLADAGEKIKTVFFDIFDKVKDFFSTIFNNNSDKLGDSSSVLDRLTDSLKRFAKAISPAKVAAVAVSAIFLLLSLSLINLVTSFSNVVKSAKSVVDGVGLIVKNFNKMAFGRINTDFYQFGMAIAFIAGSLTILASIPVAQLKSAGLALLEIGGVLAILTGVMTGAQILLAKFAKGSDITKVSVSFMSIAGAIFIMANAMKALNDVELNGGMVGKLAIITVVLGIMVAWTKLISSKFAGKPSWVGIFQILALALGMNMICKALDKLTSIPLDKIKESLPTFIAVLELLGVISKVMGHIGFGSAAALFVAVAVYEKLAPKLKVIGEKFISIASNWEKLFAVLEKIATKYPGGLLVGLGTIIVAAGLIKKTGSSFKDFGKGLLTLSISLLVLSKLIDILGGMDKGKLVKGIGAIAAFVGLISILELCSGKLKGVKFTSFASGVILLTVAMYSMTGLITVLSMLDAKTIVKGELALAGLVAMLAVLEASASNITSAKATIAATIAVLFGLSTLVFELIALSMVGWEDIAKGVTGIYAVIVALLVVFKAINSINSVSGKVSGTLIKLGGALLIITSLTVDLIALSKEPWQNLLAAAGSMSLCLLAVANFIATLSRTPISSNVTGMLSQMAVALIGIGGIAAALKWLSSGDTDWTKLLASATAISEMLLAVSVVMLVMTAIGPAGAGAAAALGAVLSGIAAIDAIAVDLLAMSFVLGAITQNQQVKDFISNGGQVLIDLAATLGNCIGAFAGGIIGSIGKSVSGALPTIASNLSQFTENLKPMVADLDSFASDTGIVTGADNISKAIMSFVKAGIFSSIGNIFGGEANVIDSFTQMGEAISAFKDKVKDIDPSTVVKINILAQVTKALAEAADAVPVSGGLAQAIAGSKDLKAFSEELSDFGETLTEDNGLLSAASKVAEQADGNGSVPGITAMANIIASLSESAKTIPNSGGFVGAIVGNNDIGEFANQLATLGETLVGGEDSGVEGGLLAVAAQVAAAGGADNIQAICDVVTALSDTAKGIQNTGGFAGMLLGNNDLGTFASTLTKMCKELVGEDGLLTVASQITNDDVSNISRLNTIMANLITTANTIKSNSVEAGEAGTAANIAQFANSLKTFVPDLKQALTDAANLNTADAQKISDVVKITSEAMIKASQVDTSASQNLVRSMTQMAWDAINGFGNAFRSADISSTGITEFINNILSFFTNNLSTFRATGEQLANNFVSGFGSATSGATSVAQGVVNAISSTLGNGTSVAYNAGVRLGAAVINGLNSKDSIDPPAPYSFNAANIFQGVVNAGKQVLSNGKSTVRSASISFGQDGVIAPIKDTVSKGLSSITKKGKDYVSNIASSIGAEGIHEKIYKEIWGGSDDPASAVTSGVNSFSDALGRNTSALDKNTSGKNKNTKATKANSAANSQNAKSQEEIEKEQKILEKTLKYTKATVKSYTEMYGNMLSAFDNKKPLEGAKKAVKDLAEEIYKASLTGDETVDKTKSHEVLVAEAFNKAFESIEESLTGSIDLFNKFNDSVKDAISPEDLMKNSISQFSGLVELTGSYYALALKGYSQAVISFVEKQGPKAISTINTLLRSSSAQVEKFNSRFALSTSQSFKVQTASAALAAQTLAMQLDKINKIVEADKKLEDEGRELFDQYDSFVASGDMESANNTMNQFIEKAHEAGLSYDQLRDRVLGVAKSNAELYKQMIDRHTEALSVLEEFKNRYDTINESIKSLIDQQITGFEKIESASDDENKKTIDDFQDALDSQKSALEQWTDDMQELMGNDDLSDAFKQQLSKIGPKDFETIHTFAEASKEEIQELSDTFDQIAELKKSSEEDISKQYAAAAAGGMQAIRDAFNEYKETGITLFGDNAELQAQAQESGTVIGTGLVDGLTAMLQPITSTASDISQKADDAITSKIKYEDGYKHTSDYMIGMINGLKDYKDELEEAMKEISDIGDDPYEDWDEGSPSKKSRKYAKWYLDGLTNGFRDYSDQPIGELHTVSDSVLSTMRDAVEQAKSIIESDNIDASPVITPIVDLSEAKSGAKTLGSLMKTKGFRINASIGRVTTSTDKLNAMVDAQNGSNSKSFGNNFVFTQNNYSPKALSRLEIYRQTKNQFAQLKGLVT